MMIERKAHLRSLLISFILLFSFSSFASANQCPADFDMDGIPNDIDLDDDNDGILDADDGGSIIERVRINPALLGYTAGAANGGINVGPVDVSAEFEQFDGTPWPAGSIIVEVQDSSASSNTVWTARNETDPTNGAGRMILTGTADFSVEVQHGVGLPNNAIDGIQINDGGATAFIGTAFAGFPISLVGNRYQVQNTSGSGAVPAGSQWLWETDSRDFNWFTINSSNSVVIINMFVESLEDFDGDGFPNRCDLDSDDDGVSDLIEGGSDPAVVDTDGDGVYDDDVGATTGAGVTPLNTDTEGNPDFLDLDSDNDGLSDVLESGGADTDGDGVINAGEPLTIAPLDTDNDGTPDHQELDSDNDGLSDVLESGGADADGDGEINAGEPLTTAPIDTDNDGTADHMELDSDNDGLSDVLESGGVDVMLMVRLMLVSHLRPHQ